MSDQKNSNIPPESEKINNQEIRYVPVEYIPSLESDEDEINLLDLVEIIWNGRKILLVSTIFFTVWGLFHVVFGPDEYESESILIQETRTQGGQAQQLLQALGGGSFRASSGEQGVLPPELYPRIIESIEFQYSMIFEEIEFDRFESTTTLFDYFNHYYEPSFREKFYNFTIDYTVKLPFTIYRLARNLLQDESRIDGNQADVEIDDRILSLSSPERRAISQLSGRITIEMDGNLITAKTKLPDPKAAAQVNILLVQRIQEFVTDYRIEKARQNLEFTESQQLEAQERYENAQRDLARFSDQNVSLSTAIARTEREHFQNQRDLTFNIYNSISQQVEQARLTLQEETPVFSTLQKSNLPTSTVGSSILIPIVFILSGMVLGISWIIVTQVYNLVIPRLKESYHSE